MKENEYEPIEAYNGVEEILGYRSMTISPRICLEKPVRALEESHKKAMSDVKVLREAFGKALYNLEKCHTDPKHLNDYLVSSEQVIEKALLSIEKPEEGE